MKRSRYTICVDDGNEHLLYNTATGAFAALDDVAFAEFQADGGAFSEELALAGFLTDSSPAEELAHVRERFDAARCDRSTLTLSFVPTYACNYRCPYCYELGHNKVKGKMDERMMDVICAFAESRYEESAFTRLSVQWYGGDPSLALDVVEELSSRLISWCGERDVVYDAMMITNANLVDEQAARLIADARVTSVLLTIDGPEELHNQRRVAADGSNSYERNIQAARLLRALGIHVFASMNVDKVSWPLYPALRDQLAAEEGISLNPGKLCDYGGCFGRAPFCEPNFDLFTHEEFAHARLEQYGKESHTVDEMHELLRPIDRFCTGQLDNYYVIDLLGDVYNCDGWVGDKQYVRFNLFDDPGTWKLADVSHDPTRDEKCSSCDLLPVCMGSCHWERACNDWPCHPFRYTLDGYLKMYRSLFDEPTVGYTLLAL